MAMTIAGVQGLALEQVPEFKASIMSIGNSFENIGGILAITAGSLVLNIYNNNFQYLAITLGGMGLISIPLLLLLSKDPVKANQRAC